MFGGLSKFGTTPAGGGPEGPSSISSSRADSVESEPNILPPISFRVIPGFSTVTESNSTVGAVPRVMIDGLNRVQHETKDDRQQ